MSIPKTGQLVFLYVLFAIGALVVYSPALEGEFLSDDLHYVRDNVYVHTLSVDNVLAILDPTGGATVAVVNYTPVHLLIHAVAWAAFGQDVMGHHVINVLLHALASILLLALLMRSGVPGAAALLGSLFFLLHPANVEAVAWISQLKSSAAMVLSLASLLAFWNRPVLATALFCVALFAKPTAAFVLPVALVFEWTRDTRRPAAGLQRWWAYGAAGLIFVLYAVIEFTAHQRSGAAEATLHGTPLVLIATVVALAMRYLVMAASSYGVSAFHEPDPVTSVFDPWWLAALPLLVVLAWRWGVVLRDRRPEAAYWTWAVVSFAPISQVFPFLYPMADRYLYFILPGLIGGVLLAGVDLLERKESTSLPAGVRRGLLIAVVLVLCVFTWHSHDRSKIWRKAIFVSTDAALHYPNGVSAQLLSAKRAAQIHDVETATARIRAAMDRGFYRFQQLDGDPGFAPIREHPEFRALINEIAEIRIEMFKELENPTQLELRTVARAHAVRGEIDETIAVLKRALAVGGPKDAETRRDLAAIAKQRGLR
ncbi:hypothetical protein MK489_00570 [Myxococcota bacterium]|nr:hypothetical protein [Myxococcota bacterium]